MPTMIASQLMYRSFAKFQMSWPNHTQITPTSARRRRHLRSNPPSSPGTPDSGENGPTRLKFCKRPIVQARIGRRRHCSLHFRLIVCSRRRSSNDFGAKRSLWAWFIALPADSLHTTLVEQWFRPERALTPGLVQGLGCFSGTGVCRTGIPDPMTQHASQAGRRTNSNNISTFPPPI